MKAYLFLLALLLLPLTTVAETFEVSPDTTLHFSVPQGWQWAKTPPQELLEEMAEHIGHEAEKKGHKVSHEKLLKAAKKRLQANEIILVNPVSLAYLTLDMSRLRQGEKAPREKTIKLSAKYSGQSLEQEEGVSSLTGNTRKVSIDGARYAYRYDAEYLHHEVKTRFAGIIGYAEPNWFFFYYTDHLKDPADREKAEEVFNSIRIEKN